MKTIIVASMLAILGGVAYVLWQPEEPVDTEMQSPQAQENTNTNSAMRAESNMVVVNEQKPGKTVEASMVSMVKPGYLVIRADKNGEPGEILGSSKLLPAGDSTNITVTLSRATADGEMVHAMLYAEADGNSSFSASTDTPVQSAMGGLIDGYVYVSSEAVVDTPINI